MAKYLFAVRPCGRERDRSVGRLTCFVACYARFWARVVCYPVVVLYVWLADLEHPILSLEEASDALNGGDVVELDPFGLSFPSNGGALGFRFRGEVWLLCLYVVD